ncbi:hypothetical protein COO91_06359 [Nostoc flagelliforme CCNUN1]|uniref:Uncharacterized protein n=1 Tax=Nostoc flagelliforme CCNUN1 TaxID=2038116 RepID=A0A2K8SY93_9NOSO|nr:hypothetical protein COO91_06359 [Nostoc flagelliforme CCNUN1]
MGHWLLTPSSPSSPHSPLPTPYSPLPIEFSLIVAIAPFLSLGSVSFRVWAQKLGIQH